MKSLTETEKFAYVTIAMITLISFMHKPPTAKETKAAQALILSTKDLLDNYQFVMEVKSQLSHKLSQNFMQASDSVFDEVRAIKLRPDLAAQAIDIGVKYLRKNAKITAPKISVIEQIAEDLGIPFKTDLSFWIR